MPARLARLFILENACLEDTATRHPRAWAREFERCTNIRPADPDDEENAPRTGFGYPRWPGWLSLSIFGRETEDGEFIRTRSDRLVTFPENRGRYCNMLPFRFDDLTTLPTEFHGYIDLIQRCQSSREPPLLPEAFQAGAGQ